MTMRKAFVSAASVLAVLMAVSLTFLIPSGAVTEEAQQRYLDARLCTGGRLGGSLAAQARRRAGQRRIQRYFARSHGGRAAH